MNRLRRQLLQGLSGSVVAALSLRATAQSAAVVATEEAPPEERYLELTSIHSRQTVRAVYKRGSAFQSTALESFKQLLVDRRSGDVHDMDPALYDQLFDLARAASVEPRYEVISAYRSKESNDQMSSRPGSGVSKKSLHMQGRAIDVRLKNYPTAKLRDLALAAKRGGVGYYEKSDFVHIDTGRFRTWVG
jgi:uncharacterized protein YcbK (DUF882 family)